MRSGDFVTLKVIERIVGSKWAVSLQGRVIPAYSDLDLTPGKTLRALVTRRGEEGRHFLLKLIGETENPLEELLMRQGLTPDKDSLQIVSSLIRSGVNVRPGTIYRIKNLLKRLKLDPRRFSRLLALLLDKQLDLSSAGIEKLLMLLGYGEGNSREQRRYKNRNMPEQAGSTAEELKKSLSEPEGSPDSSLALFNHLKGSGEHWIIIPYGFTWVENGGAEHCLNGTIRLQYDEPGAGRAIPGNLRPKKIVLIVNQDGALLWSFVLRTQTAGKKTRLSIFCSDSRSIRKSQRAFEEFRAKLQNLRVEIDDTIFEDNGFDGFSPTWEEIVYRRVNVKG